ncbi:HlyD family secretion protein [Pleionea mediterranea]|uniref:CusB/HlyD membrane fusion family barrel-sandwich protein n=1 Tax=Pleionea mediterranea TaxID=523701 RepID=A0A316FIS3_9GAMM|nr:HlyD family efflux transporter periplasmic adaptor subunit [Pleionea mediterranea]PWK48634.1 CusB/HlyD membrane fusion family barrel-sandwich protein [Pleionea mediterranea]
MDIQREIKVTPLWRKYWYLLPIFLLVAGTVWARYFLGDTAYIVDKKSLRLAQAERGNFTIEVRGTGVLKPKDTRWVSTQVAGRVEQVFVKPGAVVKQGDPLLQLANPQLNRELEKAQWELKATQAENQAKQVALESQLLELENNVEEAKFQYQSTKLKLDAETELISQGGGSISKIEYQRTKLAVDQQYQRWKGQQRRLSKMHDNMQSSLIAQNARLELIENDYQQKKQSVNHLLVKAPQDGVVQSFSLELGQQTNIGSSVGTIANQRDLYAELSIQELQVKDISLGQAVIIDTRSSNISGKVSRIDPAVKSGLVTIDVALTQQLPAEARPDLNVEGRIVIQDLADTLYIKRPTFAPSNSTIKLFRVSDNQMFADQILVDTGLSSVNQIEIKSGLNPGDTIIISDSSKWQKHKRIMLN